MEEPELSQEMTARLRVAAKNEPVPPFLESRVRSSLRASSVRRPWSRWLLAATAAVICLVGGLAYQSSIRDAEDTYMASISGGISTLIRVGLGNHVHCSILNKSPKPVTKALNLLNQLGPEYQGLVPVVRRHVPAEFELMAAHRCRTRDRRFVHLSLRNRERLLSVVIARKGPGESLELDKTLPAVIRAGVPLYEGTAKDFQVAAIESRDHLVYVVSDLSQSQNTELLADLAPDVKSFLDRGKFQANI